MIVDENEEEYWEGSSVTLKTSGQRETPRQGEAGIV